MTDFNMVMGLLFVYVASVLGVALKFRDIGVKGTSLWHCVWMPCVVIRFPVSVLLLLYVPGFNKRTNLSFLDNRMAEKRIGFALWVVVSSVQAIPIFTSILAMTICESQGEAFGVKQRVWAQAMEGIAPYMVMKWTAFITHNANEKPAHHLELEN